MTQAATGIVLELQRECLDSDVSVSSILRKAKLIASKLDLKELQSWIESELNGYECSPEDLPSHRKGAGSPKFHNRYNGWCPIMTDDGKFSQIIRTVFLLQPVSELENLVSRDDGHLIMEYNPVIQEAIQKQMPRRMECALHFSKGLVIAALDFVRNKMLDWTLELEKQGILGERLTFKDSQKHEAKAVTNHIYGGNIGVIGNVAGDVRDNRFFSSSNELKLDALRSFVTQATEAANGLDSKTRDGLLPRLNELSIEAESSAEPSKIGKYLASIRSVLEGASGNIVAQAILNSMG